MPGCDPGAWARCLLSRPRAPQAPTHTSLSLLMHLGVQVLKVVPNNKVLGAAFKKDQKAVKEALEALGEADAMAIKVG